MRRVNATSRPGRLTVESLKLKVKLLKKGLGRKPRRDKHGRKKYEKYKIGDDSYRVPDLVELIFPDWF